MPTVADTKKNIADWLKWGVMLSWAVTGAIGGHAISTEHRLTQLESWKESHEKTTADTKRDIYRRLDKVDDNQAQLLKIMSDVQASVSSIRGYLEGSKSAHQQ
jgi:hypothetical protein